MNENQGSSKHLTNKHICQSLHFSEAYLAKCEIETNLECPVKNCNDLFSNRSALNFHLEKVHRIALNVNVLSSWHCFHRSNT